MREAVGTFRSEEQLEATVSELASAGWDRADMSLLTSGSTVAPHVEPDESIAEAADDPDAPRGAVVSDPDMQQGRTLVSSTAGVAAAFAAAGAVVATGGGALAALVGAAVIGGGATAATHAAARWLSERRSDFMDQQVAQGGILLWVVLRKPDQDQRALDILRRNGAEHVHIHRLPVEEAHAPPPVGG